MWPFYRYCDRLKQTDYTLARWEWALPHLNVNCIPSSGRILKQGWSRFLDIKLGRGALRWVSLDRRDSTDTAVFLRFGIFCILKVLFPGIPPLWLFNIYMCDFVWIHPEKIDKINMQINATLRNLYALVRAYPRQLRSSKSMLTSRQKITDPIVISFI